jgi:hypothetical protein
MYIFTSNKSIQHLFIHGTHSGSMCINDTILQYVGKKRSNRLDVDLNANLYIARTFFSKLVIGYLHMILNLKKKKHLL